MEVSISLSLPPLGITKISTFLLKWPLCVSIWSPDQLHVTYYDSKNQSVFVLIGVTKMSFMQTIYGSIIQMYFRLNSIQRVFVGRNKQTEVAIIYSKLFKQRNDAAAFR